MLDVTPIVSRLLEMAHTAAPGLAGVAGDARTADLREAGLTSIGAVRLMLEIESAFDIAIPDDELTPANFASVASIEQLIQRLKAAFPA